MGTGPAGRALHCLFEHARHLARTTADSGLPSRLLDHLDTILEGTGRTPQTAAALGPYLPSLHQRAPDWVHAHRSVLLALPADGPSAASAWLRWGRSYPPLLADLDRAALLSRLRDGAPETTGHIAVGLLGDMTLLGDPAALFAQIADTDVGPTTASRLLERLAHHTARAARAEVTAAAVELWRAALAASLPEGAVAGAGSFAATDIDDTTWLDLTLASARHTAALSDADHVAKRATEHPHCPEAAQIIALLVACPSTDPWRDATVRAQARRLLTAIGQLPPEQRPAEPRKKLRDALIIAGDIDAHQL